MNRKEEMNTFMALHHNLVIHSLGFSSCCVDCKVQSMYIKPVLVDFRMTMTHRAKWQGEQSFCLHLSDPHEGKKCPEKSSYQKVPPFITHCNVNSASLFVSYGEIIMTKKKRKTRLVAWVAWFRYTTTFARGFSFLKYFHPPFVAARFQSKQRKQRILQQSKLVCWRSHCARGSSTSSKTAQNSLKNCQETKTETLISQKLWEVRQTGPAGSKKKLCVWLRHWGPIPVSHLNGSAAPEPHL